MAINPWPSSERQQRREKFAAELARLREERAAKMRRILWLAFTLGLLWVVAITLVARALFRHWGAGL